MMLFVSSFVYANDVPFSEDNEILDKIEANKTSCVAGYTENRIYLYPDRIVPTEKGLYLNLNDHEFVLLPSLNSDGHGCYVPCIQIFNNCPGCGQEYFITCRNPDCPLVKKNNERDREKEREKERRKEEKKKDKSNKKR